MKQTNVSPKERVAELTYKITILADNMMFAVDKGVEYQVNGPEDSSYSYSELFEQYKEEILKIILDEL